MFFAAFFGVTGLVLRGLGVNGVATAVAAVAMGLFAAMLNTRLTAFLKRSGLTSELRGRYIAGHPARVTVPISPGRKGKVAVEVDGQPMTLVAVPYDEARQAAFSVGDPVVIVEVDGGTALVAHLDGLEDGGLSW